MLLVACAVSARTTLVACGDNHTCTGFYPTDATQEDVVTQDVQACFGFYPTDAAQFDAGPFDADRDADAGLDASDADETSDAGDE